MTDIAIRVENVSKRYRLGLIGGRTLRADFERWWAKVRGKPDPLLKIGQEDYANRQGEYIWALRDVSFEVKEGEVLGIPSTSSGQASAATERARAPLLRQAQYKAQDPFARHGSHFGTGQGQGAGSQPAGGLP
jgi:ABC-type sugar transport system ATPase subunit